MSAGTTTASAGRHPRRRAFVLALSLCGCPLLELARGDREFEVDTSEFAADDAEAIDARLRAMTTCRDDLLESISVSWKRYQSQVDGNGKPVRQREGMYLRSIERSAFRRCDALTELAATRDPDELDLALVAVVTAAREYTDRFRDLAEYLDSEAYRADDWARLALLHPLLEGTHGRWVTVDEELGRLIFEAQSANDPRYLELLEQRGDLLELSVRALMVQARPLAECVAGENASAPGACDEELAGFESAWVRFTERREADAAAADSVFWMSTFIDDVTEYRQRVRAHLDHAHNRSRGADDVKDLAELYAALVRDASTLDFSFP